MYFTYMHLPLHTITIQNFFVHFTRSLAFKSPNWLSLYSVIGFFFCQSAPLSFKIVFICPGNTGRIKIWKFSTQWMSLQPHAYCMLYWRDNDNRKLCKVVQKLERDPIIISTVFAVDFMVINLSTFVITIWFFSSSKVPMHITISYVKNVH